MGSSQWAGVKRFLLWDYPRAGWQYDLMVALILSFIFFTPRYFFRDQPRAANIVRLPSEQDLQVFYLGPDLLLPLPEGERGAKVEELLRSRFSLREKVVRLQPIVDEADAESEVRGFMAYTRP